MIKTVFYAVYFFIVVFTSEFYALAPYGILRVLRLRKAAEWYMRRVGSFVHRLVILGTGSKIRVQGLENIPSDAPRLCVVSNHQSAFDIPLIYGYIPLNMGFVAKKELKWVPLLNFWISAIGSVYIERKSARSAIESIKRGVDLIKSGRPLAIFPEGTRGRGGPMASFKVGSLKLALRSDAVVLPVTVNNTYRIYESTEKIQGAEVTLVIHPPVETANLRDDERKQLPQLLEEKVRSGLIEEPGE